MSILSVCHNVGAVRQRPACFRTFVYRTQVGPIWRCHLSSGFGVKGRIPGKLKFEPSWTYLWMFSRTLVWMRCKPLEDWKSTAMLVSLKECQWIFMWKKVSCTNQYKLTKLIPGLETVNRPPPRRLPRTRTRPMPWWGSWRLMMSHLASWPSNLSTKGL